MNKQKMERRARKILHEFDKYSQSDPFGWDFATMTMIFPELMAEYKSIALQFKEKQDKENLRVIEELNKI